MEIENYCWFFIIFFFRMLSNIKFALENKPEKKSIHYNRPESRTKKHLCFYIGFMVIIFSFICLIRQTIISHMDILKLPDSKLINLAIKLKSMINLVVIKMCYYIN